MSLLPLLLLLLAFPVEGLEKEEGLLSSIVRWVEDQFGELINEEMKDVESMLSNEMVPKNSTLSDGPAWPAENDFSLLRQHDEDEDEEPLPEYFSWQNKGLLQPPQDQMSCGSCWVFPLVSQLEFLYKVYTGEFVKFSEQYLSECYGGKGSGSCGCTGGKFKWGAHYIMEHQYMPTEEVYGPYKTDCAANPKCEEKGKNGFTKLWFPDYMFVGGTEANALKWLQVMPIYASMDTLEVPSNVAISDAACFLGEGHSMLLVGYTKKALIFKDSRGLDNGVRGFAWYTRGSWMRSCKYFQYMFMPRVDYRREIEYAKGKVNGKGGKYTHSEARQACKAMDTDKESGWDLAVIPTAIHFEKMKEHFTNKNADIHIGLIYDRDNDLGARWVDPLTAFIWSKWWYYGKRDDWESGLKKGGWMSYVNLGPDGGNWRDLGYGLMQWHKRKNLKLNFACSRFKTCWNFDTFIEHAKVAYEQPSGSDGSLIEGTIATITCDKSYTLNGPSKLTCKGGRWLDGDGKIYHPAHPEWVHWKGHLAKLDKVSKRNDFPKCQ